VAGDAVLETTKTWDSRLSAGSPDIGRLAPGSSKSKVQTQLSVRRLMFAPPCGQIVVNLTPGGARKAGFGPHRVRTADTPESGDSRDKGDTDRDRSVLSSGGEAHDVELDGPTDGELQLQTWCVLVGMV
jgi:hypothetical protein